MTVRIRDVAERAGVSTATVSRVLTGVDKVSERLSSRVWQAVRELDYRPNRVARRLRRPGGATWALIVPDVENRFFTSVARGVELVASENEIAVFIGNSDDDAARVARYVQTALAEQVGGVIIAPSSPHDDVSALIAAKTPTVTIDQGLPGLPLTTVMTDHFEGGRLAGTALLRRGRTRVGVIASPQSSPDWNERIRGLEATLEGRGHVVAVTRGDNRVAGGHRAMSSLLAEHPELTAVFVTNNLMTVGALRALDEAGVSVPDHLDVVGYDLNSEEWPHQIPVATVNQDPRRIGEVAARTLLDLAEAGAAEPQGRTILLSPVLQEPD